MLPFSRWPLGDLSPPGSSLAAIFKLLASRRNSSIVAASNDQLPPLLLDSDPVHLDPRPLHVGGGDLKTSTNQQF